MTRRRVARFALAGVAAMTAATAVACGGDAPARRDTTNAATRQPGASRSSTLAARAAQRCDAPEVSLVIDSAGIGPVLLHARVADLASRCTVRDSTFELEGMPERAHSIAIGEHAVLVLSTGTPDTSVIRVSTTDPAFRTPGGVGVGSSVESLRLAHGAICAARGEGNFVVTAARLPGVSFAIDWNPPASREPAAAETPFPGGDPGTSLDATRITRAWVHGVTGGCRVGVG